jgi:hypothetical protein
MDMIRFLVIFYVVAFFAGAAMMEGKTRNYYLVGLTCLFFVGLLNEAPGLRAKMLRFWFGIQETSAKLSNQMAAPAPTPAPAGFQPFYIYHDKNSPLNHFTASGYMPDGYCIGYDDAFQPYPKEGKTSIAINFDPSCARTDKKWGGIYWQHPANNWGNMPGGYNLKGATKLVFWARGERGGERIEEFRVGGIGPFEQFPDTGASVLPRVTLTREWKEYTIDLHGQDLSRISGGFAWSTNVEANPESCVFYLDEIRFE